MTGDRKREYLAALGISLWLPRRPLAGHPQAADSSLPPVAEGLRRPPSRPIPPPRPPCRGREPWDRPQPTTMGDAEDFESLPPDDWIPPMTDDWEPVFETAADQVFTPPTPSREARIARMDWEELATEARQCAACGLCATRTQAVFGVGDHVRPTGW